MTDTIPIGWKPKELLGKSVTPTGATTARLLADLFADVADVSNFGAAPGASASTNSQAIQAAHDSLPNTGGVVYFSTPGSYTVNDTLIVTKPNVTLYAWPGGDSNNNAGTIYSTRLIVETGAFAATDAMILTQYPDRGAAQEDWNGGLEIIGLELYAGLTGVGSGCHGVHIKRVSGDTNFWGRIRLDHVKILNGNKGVYLDDNGQNTGFGWVDITKSRIGSCNYGVYANVFVNVVHISQCQIWQNGVGGSGNYLTRTGGGIVLPSGTGLQVRDCDVESNQVAVHTGMFGVTLSGNYYENCVDASVVLNGASNVLIDAGGGAAGVTKDRQIYCYNSRNVTLRNSGAAFEAAGAPVDSRMYLVIAPWTTDVVTDTATLTEFTVDETGGQDLTPSRGFVISTPSTHHHKWRPSIESHRPMAGKTFNFADMTKAAGGIIGPYGRANGTLKMTTTANYRGVTVAWSAAITVVVGQYAVLSAWLFAPLTNTSATVVYEVMFEGINGAALASVHEGAVPVGKMVRGEWNLIQWVHKVITGETSIKLQGVLYVVTSGDALILGGATLNIVDAHNIIPHVEVMGGAENVTDCFLDVAPDFYGTGKPADANLSWNLKDRIWLITPPSAGSPGWICTTAGTGGGTAKWAAIANLGAEGV
jgi:hypothetical protein